MSASIIILLGAPGAGKGTVAQYLKDKYDVCHFSTGNLLRDEVKKETDIGLKVKSILGSGGLVDDSIVNGIVEHRIGDAVSGYDAVILDGYPRTKKQAVVLDGMLDGTLKSSIRVVEIDVDEDEVVARISGRKVCSQCGKTYGPLDEFCSCGGDLVKRKDDEESVVRKRLEKYVEETLPISAYYSDRLVKVSGKGTQEEVAQRIDEVLRGFGIKKRR